MAHTTHSHRRNLASSSASASDPPKTSISMDPTLKPHHHHSVYSPDLNPSSQTIHNISTQFSKLYANRKLLKSSLKAPTGHHSNPPVNNNTHSQAKNLAPASTTVFDSSCTALTKSKSHHGRKFVKDIDKAIVLHEPHQAKKVAQTENDVKRVSTLLLKSQDSETLKGFEKGCGEIKKTSFSLSMNGGCGGRRKSFCSSKTELADFLCCSGVKVVSVDMPPFMQIHAVDVARKAHDSLEKFTSKSLALTLKKEFDGEYGPAWHCIVGTSFGSFVTHSVGCFIYFSMDQKLYVLLFKTTVQRAVSS